MPDHEPNAPPRGEDDAESSGLNRRQLVKGAATTAGLLTVGTFWFTCFGEPARRRLIDPTEPGAPLKNLTALEYRTLGAAQDRLLPSEGPASPGARDVNAIGYLDAVFASGEISKETIALVKWGATVLNHRARNRFNAEEYAVLTSAERDGPINAFVKYRNDPTNGRASINWIRKMLSLTLEAFFGDPVHGGNPEEIAWKWANYTPPAIRPTEPNWRPEGE